MEKTFAKRSVHKDIILSSSEAVEALADFVIFTGRLYPNVPSECGRRFLESVRGLEERRGMTILRALAKEFLRIPFDQCRMSIEAETTSRVVFVEKGETVISLSFGYAIVDPRKDDVWDIVECVSLEVFGSEADREQILRDEYRVARTGSQAENILLGHETEDKSQKTAPSEESPSVLAKSP